MEGCAGAESLEREGGEAETDREGARAGEDEDGLGCRWFEWKMRL